MSQNEKTERQFGLWSSPITPTSLSRGIGFSDVAWDESGTLVWRETRSDLGILVVQAPDGQAVRDLNNDLSVRARVGYGGGDFTVAGGKVYFAEAESGRIYVQPLDSGIPIPLTPAFGAAAAPQISPDGRWIVFVHTYEGQDVLGIVDVEGQVWPARLAAGHDFYMQPAWHPTSQRIAFVAWDHPNMPWDGTELYIADLEIPGSSGLPAVKNLKVVAGGKDISIFQPVFSPDGKKLAYASDETGWWQLYVYDLGSEQHRQLTTIEAEHAEPAWGQGMRTFGFSADGKRLYFVRNQAAIQSLWSVEIKSVKESRVELDCPYTNISQLAVGPQDQIAMIASAGDIPLRVIVHARDGSTRVLRRSTAENFPAGLYAKPEAISWQGMDGGEAYGLFYPPQNERFTSSGRPPLVVNIHGGPTSQRVASFNISAQFFTSRGYAYLEVNYRGSTGYGRAYRNMLRRCWGIYDVADAVSGARMLSDSGKVDSNRLVIMGGSAGGFTVLKALEDYPGLFKAGICLYGVSNQFTLAAETHKFEARYSDTLLGPLPEASDVYRQRSPIFFADQIRDPLAVFQGEIDMVVPRAQSDEIVAALQHRGVPHIYHVYPGEGHGFRKAENIEHLYKTIEKFLQQYVIFA